MKDYDTDTSYITCFINVINISIPIFIHPISCAVAVSGQLTPNTWSLIRPLPILSTTVAQSCGSLRKMLRVVSTNGAASSVKAASPRAVRSLCTASHLRLRSGQYNFHGMGHTFGGVGFRS
jgi:hypothetical protein